MERSLINGIRVDGAHCSCMKRLILLLLVVLVVPVLVLTLVLVLVLLLLILNGLLIHLLSTPTSNYCYPVIQLSS